MSEIYKSHGTLRIGRQVWRTALFICGMALLQGSVVHMALNSSVLTIDQSILILKRGSLFLTCSLGC